MKEKKICRRTEFKKIYREIQSLYDADHNGKSIVSDEKEQETNFNKCDKLKILTFKLSVLRTWQSESRLWLQLIISIISSSVIAVVISFIINKYIIF